MCTIVYREIFEGCPDTGAPIKTILIIEDICRDLAYIFNTEFKIFKSVWTTDDGRWGAIAIKHQSVSGTLKLSAQNVLAFKINF